MKYTLLFEEFINGKNDKFLKNGQLFEGGGESAGKLELYTTDFKEAKTFIESEGHKITDISEDFEKNFNLAKSIIEIGRTRRKDMPVINDDDAKEFQKRLKDGHIDINAPYSDTYDGTNPFPTGLSGWDAKDFLERGLKDKSKKDDRVELEIERIKAKDLKPIQKQIYFDKSVGACFQFGIEETKKFLSKKTFFITSSDNYIIDGHHRFLSAILIDPDMKINALKIDLPISELLPLATAYGDSIGNKRND